MMNFFLLFVLLPAVLLGAGFLYTKWWEARTEKVYPPQGSFLESRGIRLHYVRKGEGNPVVLIHGSFATLNYYTSSIFDRLAGEFDTLAFDQPGYGYSERPDHPMQMEDHADYLHEALQQLKVENPLIVAHSWGAGVALAYAIRYPEEISGVVLLNGYVRPSEGPVDLPYRVPAMPVIGKIFLESLLTPIGRIQASLRTRNAFAPNPPDPAYGKILDAFTLRSKSFGHNAEDIRNCSPSLRRLMTQFNKIKAPVFILTGDQDCVSEKEMHADWLKAKLPDSKMTIFKKTGHMIAFAWPEETLQVIRQAMAEKKEPVYS